MCHVSPQMHAVDEPRFAALDRAVVVTHRRTTIGDTAGRATADSPAWDHRHPSTVGRQKQLMDERITRFLSATVHLDGSFANHAWVSLLYQTRQAQAPEQEIDPVAVGRHARLSLSRRRRRDRRLAWLLLAVIVATGFLFIAGAQNDISIGRVAVLVLLLPFVGWLVAVWIVYTHYSQVRESAVEVFHQVYPRTRDAAPPLAADVEDRLEDVHRSNVTIFNSFMPFVGTGHTLDTWKLTLQTRTDHELDVAITPEEVHAHLAETIPQALPNVRVQRRLYVDGGTATTVPGLIPEGQGPGVALRPAAIVDEDLLRHYEVHPTRTARTYLAFVENSGNGDVVVTALIRAEQQGGTLFVEGRSQVLLPVQPGFKDVYWVSRNADQRVLPVLRSAIPAATGLWLESPLRLFRLWLGDRQDERTLRREGQRIVRNQPVNYGVSSSLRQDAMLPADQGYYGAADEVMYFRVMTQQILLSLNELLEKHGVHSSDFEEQRQLILEQTFNVDGIANAAPKGTANFAL
jgi:hypothetical protein